MKPLRAARPGARRASGSSSHQDVNGGWGGIQPAMVNSVMALRVLGYADDHPAVAKGIQAIEDFVIEEGDQLFFQPCVSPTWDTALAAKALLDSGTPPTTRRCSAPPSGCSRTRSSRRGDWQVKNPRPRARRLGVRVRQRLVSRHRRHRGHPDGAAPHRTSTDERAKARAIQRGLNWTLGMQSRNGGWGAFDTDNLRELFNKIPFADMEAMIDPPTADLTGRLLELMGDVRLRPRDASRASARSRFVQRTQEPNGSWWGRWGVNYIYGTWSVLSGLRAIGEDLRQPYVRRAVAWLKSDQNDDGGWGETLRQLRRPVARRARAEHAVADRVGAARAACRRGRAQSGGRARHRPPDPHAAGGRHAGTRRSSPAPGSRGTSTCATTCTGTTSR